MDQTEQIQVQAEAEVQPRSTLTSTSTCPEPLTVVGWLWRGDPKSRAQYTPEHANVWARMIHRHLTLPHRFVLMTDQPDAEYDPLIEPVKLWDDWRELRNETWGVSKPHCYVRLPAFSETVRDIFGDRFVSIDLDCVVTGNLDPLFDRSEEFLIYRRVPSTPQHEENMYQGSMWYMRTGARAFIYDDFKGEESIRAAARYMGTDQAWMRHRLGPDEKGWTNEDGVYGWPRLKKEKRYRAAPPENARIIFFYGAEKPWHFQQDRAPRCGQCGARIRVKPPYSIVYRGLPTGQLSTWIPKHYR